MENFKKILFLFSIATFLFSSCEPRIDFDMGQWGDNAYITDILLFIVNEEEHELQEYYENGELTTGVRRQFLNINTEISDEAASVTVNVPEGTDLSNVGLIIRHTAEKIEPLGGSPLPGYIDDFSGGSFTYRVISADGTVRDWTINIYVD